MDWWSLKTKPDEGLILLTIGDSGGDEVSVSITREQAEKLALSLQHGANDIRRAKERVTPSQK